MVWQDISFILESGSALEVDLQGNADFHGARNHGICHRQILQAGAASSREVRPGWSQLMTAPRSVMPATARLPSAIACFAAPI
jgi:hypothetical protein